MGEGVASAADPYTQVYRSQSQPANVSTSGKTASTLRGISLVNLGVFVMAGQSMAANSAPTPYTPTNSANVFNMNAYDSSVTLAKDPLIGCSNEGGNYLSRLADNLVTNAVYDRVVLAPVSIAGSSIEQWLPANNLYFNYVLTAAQRLAGWGVPITAFLWDQGTSNDGTSQASYESSLNTLITAVRDRGYTAPWLIAQHTMKSDDTTISTVRAAQAAVVNGTTIFAGPDLDTLTGATNRNAGSKPHLTDVGAASAATLWETAITTAL